MTEQQIRNQVVSTAKKYLGCKESNGTHKQIIDIYNGHRPLARGYSVKYTDAWCATFVSAVAVLCGYTDIMPTECSCAKMVQLYKNLGRWQEKDDYVPQLGDIVMYDWGDTGKGDNTGTPDHVGIVAYISGTTMKIIEGNISDSVAYRTLSVNGKYIRGYCLPDYASKATEGGNTKPNTESTKPNTTESVKTVEIVLDVLEEGAEGAQVKTLQQLLIAKGQKLPKYGADGEFGAETEKAVKAFQSAKNLNDDGVVGNDTWNKLLKG